jgi:biopolymer transport protein ExbB
MNGSLPKVNALLARASLALLAFSAMAAPLLAQDAAPAAAEEISIMGYVKASGFIGWVLIAFSIVALAVVIENLVSLRRDKLAPPELIDEVQSLFDEGRYQESMELCETEQHFFGRVCSAGIAKIGHPYDVIETALQEMGDEETVKLHQKIGWLTVIGSTAPMLGLLGTVSGMIAAFQKIATTANPSPSELAGGIYSALLTTLFGLMIAIPVIACYAFVRNRLTVAVIEIGAIAEDLFERFRPQQ